MVGKLGVLCVVAVIAGLAFAVPSNRAIEKVKADIDVIVEDVDSRKKGDWGKAADAILSLSDATTNEVERFLLRKEATFRYLKSGNGGKAKSVLSAFANDSASVLAIDEEIRRRLSFKEQRALKTAPAFADYEAFVTFVAKEQREKASAAARLADLEAKYAKDKENVRNRNLLAREYVLRDDWVKALPLLSRSKGDIGLAAKKELAKPEAKGSDAVAIGDGWWNVEEKDYPKEMTEACHRHAAEWYRTAQKDGTLANLVKMRIGGRIEEVESKSGPQVLKLSEKTEVSSVFPTAPVKGGKTIRIPLEGKGKAFVDLVACPAGEFTMGWSATEPKENPALAGIARPCEVKMSKPFWMSETLVSEKVWAEVMGEQAEGDNPKAVTYEELEKFLEKFKAKMRGKIPSGYVVRQPTYAEYEYALRAGGAERGTAFGRAVPGGEGSEAIRQAVGGDVMEPKPNSWNLRGLRMKGGFVWLADRLSFAKDEMSPTAYRWDATGMRITRISWPRTAIDPFMPTGSGDNFPVFLCDKGFLQPFGCNGNTKAFIRLVLAPKPKDGKK